MKRMAFMLALALVVGIVMGVVENQFLNAQQQPVKRTELLRTDLPGIEGKEGIVYIAELAPGAAAGGQAAGAALRAPGGRSARAADPALRGRGAQPRAAC